MNVDRYSVNDYNLRGSYKNAQTAGHWWQSNLSYSTVRHQEDCGLRPSWAKSTWDHVSKIFNIKKGLQSGSSGREMVACLPRKCEAPSSIFCTTKKDPKNIESSKYPSPSFYMVIAYESGNFHRCNMITPVQCLFRFHYFLSTCVHLCVCVCVCSRFTHYTYTTNQDTELFNQHQKTYSLLFYFASKEGKFIEIEK
jgi:hypothetical protein